MPKIKLVLINNVRILVMLPDNAANVPIVWLLIMVYNVAVLMVSWEMVSAVANYHHKDVILIANVMKQIPIALKPVQDQLIVLVDKCVLEENAVLNAVLIDLVLWVNFVNVEPAWLAARPIMTVLLIKAVLRDNVPILVPIRKLVVAMLYVLYPNIVCYVIALMVMKVNPARNVYNSNVKKMKIVNRINVVIQANAVILAWNMEPAVLMLSAVLSIVNHNAHVHPITLEMPPLNANLWKVVVPIILVAKTPDVMKYLVALNVPAWKVV